MGVYDRDYYREEEPTGILAGRSMTVNLMIANVAVFVIDMLFSDGQQRPVVEWLGLSTQFFSRPWEIWRPLTYGFVHNDIGHVLFNMIGLWCFGREVEDRYGRAEYTRIYAAILIASGLFWVLVNFLRPSGYHLLIGASGAVTGMVILSILPNPRREVLLFGIARMPAWLFACLFLLGDVMGAMKRDTPVAHVVHLAGAAFAAGYFYLGWNFGSLLPAQLMKTLTRPKLRVHSPYEDDPRDLSARVDEILKKISERGESSLTKDERRTLEEASKRYQRRQRS